MTRHAPAPAPSCSWRGRPARTSLYSLLRWTALAAAAALLPACGPSASGPQSGPVLSSPLDVPGGTIVQLTTTGTQARPEVNNAGDVVWQGQDGGDWAIFYYRAADGTISQLSPNDGDATYPVITNTGLVYWHDGTDGTGGARIYRHDLDSGQTDVLLDGIQVSGAMDADDTGNIVWYGGQFSLNNEIYLYSAATGSAMQLTSNSVTDSDPVLAYHGWVVWQGADRTGQGDSELFAYDPGSGQTTQLTDNAVHDSYADANGQGKVVWEQAPNGSPDNEVLQLQLGSVASPVTLSTGTGSAYRPRINELGDVVWQQWDGSDYEIMLLRAGSASPEAVTDDDLFDSDAVINDNGAMAWLGRADQGQEQVYLFTPTTAPANAPPVAVAGSDVQAVVDEAVHLDGNASYDPDGDPLTFVWSLDSRPGGSATGLTGAHTSMPTLVPDVPGAYGVSLVVNDGTVDSAPSFLTVTAISLEEAVDQAVQALGAAAAGLDEASFKNSNMKNALSNKIAAVMHMIDQGDYAQALSKLQNDILGKTDGCAVSGAPDSNDWIETCSEQAVLYPVVMDLIGYLEHLVNP
jgi:PKD domain